jgi:hypothetical protein
MLVKIPVIWMTEEATQLEELGVTSFSDTEEGFAYINPEYVVAAHDDGKGGVAIYTTLEGAYLASISLDEVVELLNA